MLSDVLFQIINLRQIHAVFEAFREIYGYVTDLAVLVIDLPGRPGGPNPHFHLNTPPSLEHLATLLCKVLVLKN